MKSIFIVFLLCSLSIEAQGVSIFDGEVQAITKKYDTLWNHQKETIVFTGSSSIRLWKSLETSFPGHQIVNSGFGGSQASDLLYHLDDLVIQYKPVKVFIYEGDNDIFSKKKPNQIISTFKNIIEKIRREKTSVKIILISAKPSISRWNLRGRYRRLNRKLERLSQTDSFLEFVDVWNPMLDGRKPKKHIFLEDGLHMNQKGYDLWNMAIENLINVK
ncbi:GDSL-type esterase/lipase family protein [Maribacter sp. 2304DJ31-5]|uniref:GDSL-type esterase/lipase family protein n=1 Tax=Maribacter sp. 2304DJ31-5 TaxID=3386273 RepID=UPI0039BCB2E7